MKDVIDSYSLYPDEFPDFKLTYSSANKVLAGKPAYIMIGQYEDPDFGKQMVFEIGTLKDGIEYYIQYFASPSQYKHYLPIIDNMVKSFEIQDLDNKVAVTGKPLVGIDETSPFVKISQIMEFSGEKYADVDDSRDLNVNSFTVSTCFKTPIDTTRVTYLVNKGSINKGTVITGDNLNYGLFLTKDE